MFDYIKEYYGLKLYTNDDVKIFVKAGWITSTDFKSITSTDYVAS